MQGGKKYTVNTSAVYSVGKFYGTTLLPRPEKMFSNKTSTLLIDWHQGFCIEKGYA